MIDLDEIRNRFPVPDVLRQYFGVTVNQHGKCHCPFHKDSNPSLSVSRNPHGVWRWRCHACDIGGDVIDLMMTGRPGLKIPEAVAMLTGEVQAPAPAVRPAPPPPKRITFTAVPPDAPAILPGRPTPPMTTRQGKPVNMVPEMVHSYRNAAGELVGHVLRLVDHKGKKQCFPVRWAGSWLCAGWTQEDRPPLYGLDRLIARPHAEVIVVEGEKCADILSSLPAFAPYVVVTWQGGTSSVGKSDFSGLDGRTVTFWPDADEPGRRAMRLVQARCKPMHAYWLEPPEEWQGGFDAVDALEGQTDSELLAQMLNLRDGGPAPVSEDPSRRKWLPEGTRFVLNKSEEQPNLYDPGNVYLALSHHPAFKGHLAFDVFDRKVLFRGEELTEDGVYRLRHDVYQETRFRCAVDKVALMAEAIAMSNRVNRLGDYLRKLAGKWDGEPRKFLGYAGVEMGNGWAQTVSRRWSVALARRIMEPGTKHDGMLVLEGGQGTGKSTFLDTLGKLAGRDLYVEVYKLAATASEMQKLAGKAIVEVAELVAHHRGDNDTIKGVLTARVDNYRRPYAKSFVDVPRTCVFAATTNEGTYLRDTTGNRRYWPVRMARRVDLRALERDHAQLWAEAAHRALEGEPNHLRDFEIPMQEQAADIRFLVAPWLGDLEMALKENRANVLDSAFPWVAIGLREGGKRTETLKRMMDHAMRQEGWEYRKGTTAEDRTWKWRRVEE